MQRPSADDVVRFGLQIVTLQAIGTAYAVALREQDVTSYQQALLCLTAAGLVDGWERVNVVIREAALALLRGSAVCALFLAGIDFGTAPEQVQNSGRDGLAALLLGVLVLVGQARRAADSKQERRQFGQRIEAMADDLRCIRSQTTEPVVPPAPAPTTMPTPASTPATVVAGVVGVAVGLAMGRRPHSKD